MRTAAPRDEQNHDTLLPNAGGFAAAVAIAALIAPLPWQTAVAQAVPCTAIESNEERLACYDRALRSASPAPPTSQAPAVPAAQTPNAQPPSVPAAESAAGAAVAPSSSASSASSVLGEQPSRNVRESTAPTVPEAAAAGRNDDDEDRVVPIVIVGMRTLPGRETTFTAEDGGIWIQTDSQRVVGLPEPPFEAEIRPGAIGSSFLVPKERGRAVRVRSAAR